MFRLDAALVHEFGASDITHLSDDQFAIVWRSYNRLSQPALTCPMERMRYIQETDAVDAELTRRENMRKQ
jgi:hypothetical protein